MTVSSWVSSSLVRHYPATPVPKAAPSPISIEVALNERFSFQVVMRMSGEVPQQVRLEVDSPRGLVARIRRVGYVPIRHHNTPVMSNHADMDGRGHCTSSY
jgi:hypothetical protein